MGKHGGNQQIKPMLDEPPIQLDHLGMVRMDSKNNDDKGRMVIWKRGK
jgi:hypothetical protein